MFRIILNRGNPPQFIEADILLQRVSDTVTITINTKQYGPHVSNTLTEKQITTHGDKESGPALALPNAEKAILRFQRLPTFSLQKKKKNYQRFSFSSPPPSKPNCVKEFISSLRISNLDPKRLSIYYTRHSLNSLFFLFFPSSLFSTEVATSFSPFLRSFFILLITCSFFSFH